MKEHLDFHPSEAQTAIAGLAREVLSRTVTEESQRAVEATPDRFDRQLWRRLADANLLGVGIPEEFGGIGGGMLELCTLCEEIGRSVAWVPLWPVLAISGQAISRWGTKAAKSSVLPELVRGGIVTAALTDAGSDDPARPATEAKVAELGWTLTGSKLQVPFWDVSESVLIPAMVGSGVGLFRLARKAEGVRAVPQETTTGAMEWDLNLDNAACDPGDLLVEEEVGEAAMNWTLARATLAICALHLGLADRMLEMTAEYTSNRRQFGRPIATFQAVQQRLGDSYVDVQAMRWTMWQAAWSLDRGHDSSAEVAVAKAWASEAGQRVASACLHLHGGLGVDRSYPLHRYFLRSKQLELQVGSATEHLSSLGTLLGAGSLPQYAN